MLQAHLGRVEPTHRGLEAEQLGVDDERERHIVFGGVGLHRRVVLHQLDRDGGGAPG